MSWPTGAEKLLVVSVGIGNAPRARPGLQAGDLWLLDHAKNIPSALMSAASAGWNMVCRILGECRFGGPIDCEFGYMPVGLGGAVNWTGPKQFSQVRYNPDLTAEGLRVLGLGNVRPGNVQVMDPFEFMRQIGHFGKAHAGNVSLDHFKTFV